MEHVGIVVDDLAAATEFFVQLGLELRSEGSVEGRWVDRIVGLESHGNGFRLLMPIATRCRDRRGPVASARRRPRSLLTSYQGGQDVDVLFIASVAVVAADPAKSRELYVDTLGLPLEAAGDGEYFYSERIDGSKHFGVWPLAQAAHACFGVEEWPTDRPIPQVSIEFEVADAGAVAAAVQELKRRGLELVHDAREEPWGQTVARLLSPEGSIVGISYAPSLHAGP
jgi:catechol 2,3-dioxygenase-like lactoylglutathione lyase family enzyme